MLAQCPRQAARHSLLEKLQGTMSPSRTSPVITEHRRGLVSVLRGRRAPRVDEARSAKDWSSPGRSVLDAKGLGGGRGPLGMKGKERVPRGSGV